MEEIIYNVLKIIKEYEEKVVNREHLVPFNLKVNYKSFEMAILKIEGQGLAKVSYTSEQDMPAIIFDGNTMIFKDGLRILKRYDKEKLLNSKADSKNILKNFRLVIQEDAKVNKVAINIDTELSFDKNLKYFLYMFELYTYSNKKSDKWYTINLNTLKHSTLKKTGKKLQVKFYDRNDKNSSKNLYNSRMEFRFLDILSCDLNNHIQKLMNLIDVIDQNIELLDKNMSDRIIKLYDYEINQKSVKSLSEFIRKYERYIYTDTILKNLYEHITLKGCYSEWLRNYRRTNKIELFTKMDVNKYKSNCLKSINAYMDSDKLAQ